ncbi:hypothetical protein AB0A63_20730 [Lentzea sp. NPDC042327]|uniref:SCO6745 family protein n=1 Tax=Lentzea sp. NPDC042327 TaxID=3154801 RepID=UPI0033CDC0F2
MSRAGAAVLPARQAHSLLDPLHAVTYLAEEATASFHEAGFTGPWHGYFAGRSAPLGTVPPAVVAAVFYHFEPRFVVEETTAAFAQATPARALRARLTGVDGALRALLGQATDGAEVREAAALAEEAAAACDVPGRPLGAANAALARPAEPHLALWQAVTTLREHRGDGHGIALASAGLDGVEALVSITAAGGERRRSIQARRGWTDAEWLAGEHRLVERGLLNHDGTLTEDGRAHRQAVEDTTDRLASVPWQVLGERKTRRLLELLLPLTEQVVTGLRARRPT